MVEATDDSVFIAQPATVATNDGLADVIDLDLPCRQCGYNLRTARLDRLCPECGLAVKLSLGKDNELWKARPDWLKSLSRGVWLLLIAQLMPIALLFLSLSLDRVFLPPFIGNLKFTAVIAGCWTYAAGVWLLTRREHAAGRALEIAANYRIGARLCTLALPIGVSMLALARNGHLNKLLYDGFPIIGVIVILFLLVAIGLHATYFHLRGLAARVLSKRMVEYATIVGVGGVITLLAVLFGFLMLVSGGLKGAANNGRPVVLALRLFLGIAIPLFYLWSLVVLILFARAFSQASRKARLLWHERAA